MIRRSASAGEHTGKVPAAKPFGSRVTTASDGGHGAGRAVLQAVLKVGEAKRQGRLDDGALIE
ncbi:MAG: hypothetical protein WKG07_43900 [Hymenobacter sp.]